jgi:hypothetical protein
MRKILVRAPTAMRIAHVDRLKFNEAVADGFYVCAPPADPGAARVFDEDDLIALFEWGRLAKMGISARTAGRLACMLRERLRDQPAEVQGTEKEPRISFLCSTDGVETMYRGYNPDHWAEGNRYPIPDNPYVTGIVAFSIEFNIAQVRWRIRAEMAEEEKTTILGPDDGQA